MEVVRDWHRAKERFPFLGVGLGNFDGVHLGHRRLIERLVAWAAATGGTAAVLTFEPHPAMVLNPQKAPPLLLSSELKRRFLAELGIEVLFILPFTREFASLQPEEFVAEVLVKEMGVKAVFVGYNHTFGRGGKGNPALLASLGERYGFRVEVIPQVVVNGLPVSSTLIRYLLEKGEVEEARRYLGYYPLYLGTVVSGDGRGRELGFPTANLELEEGILLPACGVYLVRVRVLEKNWYGVANVGVLPTFGERERPRIEVFLFDFQGELYGLKMEVSFLRRLREERRFRSPEELVAQIRRDVACAREIIAQMEKDAPRLLG
ncbi:bifunctional riboflavin kinase/FAD synthetase [Ammonifex thiophilus]|uniref:Riboflavin biosynthesis protein n=1 Tax=Ammonifex thiophilus TaxID=444093 RepID=A0A3D8P2N0_9THEO|nr:bifunctional riboflavin kinase/FAD synthetase [Ammonifex thiophilus]RDV82520.1 bifunctional riboflavin kinase/FAD synthetase [Ammonifex thiophilus]